MFLPLKPSREAIEAFLRSQDDAAFSYPEVGATRSGVPAGYTVDHHRIRLGDGPAVFARAHACLRDWRMFDLGWVGLSGTVPRIQPGTTVAILVHAYGLWSVHACRIVYVIDEDDSVRRFGFAYGTLTAHAERGEERFSVEWHRRDDSVWYDILAFSRPNHWLARLAHPLSRRLQHRFARDSMRAMARSVTYN